MRATSFAVFNAVLFGFAYGETTCQYETLTTDHYFRFAEDCSGYSSAACDPDDQALVEAAIATALYSQCQCVYYDATTAFNYRKGCWQRREQAGAGRCWTAAYRAFFTSGDLDAALNGPDGICSEAETTLPPPTTTEAPGPTTTEAPVPTTTEAPVPTTTEAPVPTTTEAACVDDPKGILAKFPMTCGMVLPLVGGCNGSIPFWATHIFQGETIESMCPQTCTCPVDIPINTGNDETTVIVCQDDPQQKLKNVFNTDCATMIVQIVQIGCDDPFGIVPQMIAGESAQSLCPASCDERCMPGN